MSLSTLSGTVDPKILDASGQVFLKPKFRDVKEKLANYCILNYVQLSKRNCPKIKYNFDHSNAQEIDHQVYESLYLICTHYGQPPV